MWILPEWRGFGVLVWCGGKLFVLGGKGGAEEGEEKSKEEGRRSRVGRVVGPGTEAVRLRGKEFGQL